MKNYDLVIIGSGPAALEVHHMLGESDKTVCFIEKAEQGFGGTCVNRGCMPTKLMLKSAKTMEIIKKADQFGVEVGLPKVDLAEVYELKTKLIQGLNSIHHGMTQADKIYGHGRFIDNEVVEVTKEDGTTEKIKGKNIVIATGARPRLIPGIKVDGTIVCTSDELLENQILPDRMLVVGGGALGLEFASMYKSFGTDVTIVEALPILMPTEDPDTGLVIQQCLEGRKIKVFTNTRVKHVEIKNNMAECTFEGRLTETESFEKVLIAVGRQPNTDDLGLEKTDVEIENGFIKVNDRLQTKLPHIYAAGDVIPSPMLAHTAVYEAKVIAANLKNPGSMTYANETAPRVVYTQPEIASTGLTEKEARDLHQAIKVIHFPMAMGPKGIVDNATEGRLKIIYNGTDGTLLGANMVGQAATEVIHELNLAVTCGLTIEQLSNTVHAHPTMAEAIWFALLKGTPFNSTDEFMAAMSDLSNS